jgi:hypothetical protein
MMYEMVSMRRQNERALTETVLSVGESAEFVNMQNCQKAVEEGIASERVYSGLGIA